MTWICPGEAQLEISMYQDYLLAKKFRGRTTVGASEMEIKELAPFVASFVKGENLIILGKVL